MSISEYTNESLADDAYFYHLMPKISSFPCTIEFNYEIEIKDMLASFPTFMPLPFEEGVSLENASYSLRVPKGYTFKTKKLNTNIEPIKSNEKDNDVYFWHTKNIKAYENNIFMPDYKDILPIIYISPIGFTYNKNYVNMTEWKEYGEWIYSLFEGRDILPLDLKEKVHALTDTIRNDRDKVKALYEYMCGTCRYVSVQLGIGGLQPMKVSDVYTNKFGDCKALSFYLHSMLKECGITSNYVILGTENINLYDDIVIPTMTDHVILQVPLKDETLWVECTNSENPFAYIPNSIAGHSCIVVKKGESKLSRLPKYADSLNIDYQKVHIDLDANGGAKGEITRKCLMGEHQSKMSFKHLKNNEQKEFFSKYISIPQLMIDSVSYDFIYNTHPEVDLKCKFSTPKFSNSAGIRNFIPINQFREHSPYVKATRDYDISIKYGYCDIDSIEIKLPQNIIVESLPKDIKFESIFGKIHRW